MFENVPHLVSTNQNGIYISEASKNSITNGLNFALKNETFTTIDELRVEERKERKERYFKEKHFILLYLLLFFSYFSNHSRPSGNQTSTLSGPGHFLVATGDRATAKF